MKKHRRWRSAGLAAAWLLLWGAGLTTLVWLGGHPALALPASPASLVSWQQWLATTDPVDALMAVVRVALLPVAGYLLLVTAIALVVHVSGRLQPALLLRRFAAPLARGFLRSALGIGVSVATLSPPTGAPARAAPAPVGVPVGVPPDTTVLPDRADPGAWSGWPADDDDVRDADPGAGAPLLRRLPPPRPVTPAGSGPATARPGGGPVTRLPVGPPVVRAPLPTPLPSPGHPPASPALEAPTTSGQGARPAPGQGARAGTPRAPDAADADRTHTVEPGDHFWSIAEAVVARATDAPVTEARTRRYWRRLIRANRGRLVDPGNPDYILPGQVLHLPPVRRR